jgi:hypothetical protein
MVSSLHAGFAEYKGMMANMISLTERGSDPFAYHQRFIDTPGVVKKVGVHDIGVQNPKLVSNP